MQNSKSLGRQIVTMTVAAGLVVMVVTSFVYRLQGQAAPSVPRAATQSVPDGMSQDQGVEIQKYMEMLQQNPEDTEALAGLGEIFMKSRVWDKAASFWERYVELSPQDEEGLYHLGVALLNLDKYSESVVPLKKLVQLNPQSYHGFYYLGMIHLHYLDDKVRAKEYLQKVLDLNPDHKQVLDAVRDALEKM